MPGEFSQTSENSPGIKAVCFKQFSFNDNIRNKVIWRNWYILEEVSGFDV